MDARMPRRWLGTLWVGIAVTGLAGCGGVDVVALKDNQIRELQHQSSRQAQSLSVALAEVDSLTTERADLVGERTALVSELEALKTNLRYANERADELTRERDKVREDLSWLEKQRDELERSLANVKSVASSSVAELADLRLKRQDFDTEMSAARERETRFRNENQKLTKELQSAKEELTRERAVVRSLQGDEQAAAQGLRVALEDVERLEQEKVYLLDENSKLKALEQKLRKDIVLLQEGGKLTEAQSEETERLAAAAAAVAPRSASASFDGTQPRKVETLLSELGTVVEGRYRKALRGEFTGDMFDLAVLGAAVVGLLALVWLSIRFFRVRRLSRHLRVLTARVSELEQLQVEGPAASMVGAGGRGRAARGVSGGGRSRRPSPRRRSGFSAVISTQSVKSTEAPEASDSDTADPDRVVAVLEPSREARTSHDEPVKAATPSAPSRSSGSGAVIGMGGWKDSEEPEEGFDDDLTRTQIIPSLDSDVTSDLPLPGVDSRASDVSESPKSETVSSERELLEELKATVHKKFDDLIG